MILYSLRCTCDHQFDEWFDNMAEYDRRKADGTLACPSCGGHEVAKAIMAPESVKPPTPPRPPAAPPDATTPPAAR